MVNDFYDRVYEKFHANYRISDTGCWLWIGKTRKDGYGVLSLFGGFGYAHRVSYELLVGPIPDGLVIDHLCRIRCCVNPDHLEPVTSRENLARSPLTWKGTTSRRTHCPQGALV